MKGGREEEVRNQYTLPYLFQILVLVATEFLVDLSIIAFSAPFEIKGDDQLLYV